MELGRQGVRAAAAWPRGSAGERVPLSLHGHNNPQGKNQHGLVSVLWYSHRVQNQGSWHIPRSSKELLPSTAGSAIPYLCPLCAMG